MEDEVRVGVRELKNSLSAYLRRARAGEHILVTDRGEAVARLVPPDLPPHLISLIRQGRLIPPRRPMRLPRPVLPYEPGSKLLSDAVIDQRKK
ncbi:MAG: type II toxin-antitoxin system prevent-host-death family antitoxin [Chloroflexota bacterium]|nr:type II toxin-antitoxin system prevent-host-death family antitoxin [Chloroflexota bacterium]